MFDQYSQASRILRVFFLVTISTAPSGGGNQFLAALRNEFMRRGWYASRINEATTFLINSYHHCMRGLWLKISHPSLSMIVRLGPMFHLHRSSSWKLIDRLMILIANHFADIVIFQSQWSQEQARQLGFKGSTPHVVIYNGVTKNVFHQGHRDAPKKIRLVSTSWSSNLKKGFEALRYIDRCLDWSKFEMTFIGNSPVRFSNIITLSPLPPRELADVLRQHDLFITATEDDACSNALLEALACGLPAVAFGSGANAELVGKGGIVFHSIYEVIPAILKASQHISMLRQNISVADIQEVASIYAAQCGQIRPSRTRVKMIGPYILGCLLFGIFKTYSLFVYIYDQCLQSSFLKRTTEDA